ncbi:MAG: hypothetical protein V1661_01680 [bacterium]
MPNNQQQYRGPNLTDELRKLLETYARKIEELQKQSTELADCKFCNGEGKERRADGILCSDDNHLPVPCQICKGAGKVRI